MRAESARRSVIVKAARLTHHPMESGEPTAPNGFTELTAEPELALDTFRLRPYANIDFPGPVR